MALPGETEAGSAGKQPCRGIARRAHRDDDHGRGTHLSRSSQNPIGSKDPDALKIPARRAASTLTRSARSPVPAEPAQLDTEQLCEMREELTNLEPAGVGRFVLSELDKKLEESFSRVPPDHRSLRPDWIDEQLQYLADTEAEAVPVSGDAVPF